jgi:CheY-like chemotaxis protein
MKLKFLKILIAEDDENDRFLLGRAIAKTGVQHQIHMVSDGREAIAYLRGDGVYADRRAYPFPNVLILDLKMPICSGFDVLEWLLAHEDCSVIPTLVLSSSAEPQDVKRCYTLLANAYFTKPPTIEESTRLMARIFDFWFAANVPEPPPQHACR